MNIEAPFVIREDYWLNNLRDREGVTLGQLLSRFCSDQQEHVKSLVFSHAKESLNMYCVPGMQKPLCPETWLGRFGLLHHAQTRALWLAAPDSIKKEIENAYSKWCDAFYKAKQGRDWRETKQLEREAKLWWNKRSDLISDIYGEHYKTPECLI